MPDAPPLLKSQAHQLRRKLRGLGGDWYNVDVYWRPQPRGFWMRGAPDPFCKSGQPELHLGITIQEARRSVRGIRRHVLGPGRRARAAAVAREGAAWLGEHVAKPLAKGFVDSLIGGIRRRIGGK